MRLEIVAHDNMIESIVSTLTAAAHAGNAGDGKIFVWQVESAIRIQTGEKDDKAIEEFVHEE